MGNRFRPLDHGGGAEGVPPYDKRTGRYSPTLQKFCIDKEWWQLDSGPAEDAYKTYIHAYYNGAQFINGQSERPLTDKGGKQAILRFVEFVRQAPRCKETVATIAVVESKGSYWAAPTYYPAQLGRGAGGLLQLSLHRDLGWLGVEGACAEGRGGF